MLNFWFLLSGFLNILADAFPNLNLSTYVEEKYRFTHVILQGNSDIAWTYVEQ